MPKVWLHCVLWEIIRTFRYMRRLITAFLLFQASTVSWSSTEANFEPSNAKELTLLVYNTHGLPEFFARDNPKKRFPKIGELTGGYDLSLLQEDFAHHDLLLKGVQRPQSVVRGMDAQSPNCLVCSGSGLTLVSNLSSNWTVSASFEPFNTCSGWLTKLNDCFAQKGFQLAILESAAGLRIYIVNTHLDAGQSELDRLARASQLDQIALALEADASNEAVLIVGDLNLDWESPADNELLQNFVQRLNLVLAQKGGDASSDWKTLDYIYYRSSKKTSLTVDGAGEDTAFTDNAKPLSDHPALFTNFIIR